MSRAHVLRFSGGVERDPEIEIWMQEQPEDLQAIARHWFTELAD